MLVWRGTEAERASLTEEYILQHDGLLSQPSQGARLIWRKGHGLLLYPCPSEVDVEQEQKHS